MISLLGRYFSKKREDGGEKDPNAHDPAVAMCALFLEMANIDGKFSDSEKESILSMMRSEYGLSDEIIKELMAAANEELEKSIDLWQFTNLINQNYSPEEKSRIIEMFWKVAYADGRLDSHEDYLIHKLGKLLRLSHKQLIDAKLKIKNQTT
ncbi:TerB family tellurite resistance protein [Thermodesulfobacteriota bacterium]